MKKFLFLVFVATVFNSCSLTSGTQIGPQKEFEPGDGLHGAFNASVKNDGNTTVDIYEQPLGGEAKKIASLAPGQKITLDIAADTKAIFKNIANSQASLKLKVTGDTRLSMGGPNY
ncbi:MAG: hypothetical protein SGI83_18310 [Bacteroidota bacterium]|nr:hypothetical protein [Bacteroidota bacterium]